MVFFFFAVNCFIDALKPKAIEFRQKEENRSIFMVPYTFFFSSFILFYSVFHLIHTA